MRAVLIACARDEGPFLAEWVAYHRAIGFTDILIFTNELQDGSDELLDVMAAMGLVEHLPNDQPLRPAGMSPQRTALGRAAAHDVYRGADWALYLDIDEFLNIRAGEGRLSDLPLDEADMISPCELFFAPAEEDERLLIERATLSEPPRRPRRPARRAVKTLHRPGPDVMMGVHRPRVGKPMRWLDGSGAPVSEAFQRSMRHGLALTHGHRVASINHYALRSERAFLVKAARGDAWHPEADRFTPAYWRARSGGYVEEAHIQRLAPEVLKRLAEWRANEAFAAAEASMLSKAAAHADEVAARPKSRALSAAIHRPADAPQPQVTVMTCMKNEAPFILEWVAWTRHIGATDILVFTNDCDDGTVEMLDRLAELGLCRRHDNPAQSGERQHAAFAHALATGLLADAEWIIAMDVDEFLNIHAGDGRFRDLTDLAPEAAAISLSEAPFGASGRLCYERGSVRKQFVQRMTKTPLAGKGRRGIKTLFRNEAVRHIGAHRPIFARQPSLWLDGSGRPMEDEFISGKANGVDCRGRYDLATIHHYPLKSGEDYLAKAERGDVVFADRPYDHLYWKRRNSAAEADHSLAPRRDPAAAGLKQLMEDPVLSALHDKACAGYEARIERLKNDPAYADLWSFLQARI